MSTGLGMYKNSYKYCRWSLLSFLLSPCFEEHASFVEDQMGDSWGSKFEGSSADGMSA